MSRSSVACIAIAPNESQNCVFYGPFCEPTPCSAAKKRLWAFFQTKGLREIFFVAFSLQYPTRACKRPVYGRLPISLKFVLSNFGFNPLIYITIVTQCSILTLALSGLQLRQILLVRGKNDTRFKASEFCSLHCKISQ